MPKRDDAYMSAQREAIARAAMKCLLAKGLYGTSLRDICKEAGISIGALYIHFRTLEEVFIAACGLDCGPPKPIATTWNDYVASLRKLKGESHDEEFMRHVRLSLQFIAEMTQMAENPPGLSEIYARDLTWLRSSLAAMEKAGEIELPLGLDLTVATHRRLIAGTLHVSIADRDDDFDTAIDELIVAIGLTVGRKVRKVASKPAKPAPRTVRRTQKKSGRDLSTSG